MKKYLAIYTGSKSAEKMKKWQAMSDDERNKKIKDGMTAWTNWVEKNKVSIIDNGGPLGKTKQIDASGISDIKNLMTGFTLVEAESHEAAAKLFVDHPHFLIFPGDAIEIMECLPLPQM